MTVAFNVRPGRASDLAFVVDSWVKRGHARGERMRDATARVRGILADASSELRVACLPDDEDAILGWAVVATAPHAVTCDLDADCACDRPAPSLHYAYVRKELRGRGIARALLHDIEPPRTHGLAQGTPA